MHVASHWETQSIQQQNSFFETVNYQSTNYVNQFDSFYLSHSDSSYVHVSCQSITESLKYSTKSVRQLAASETVSKPLRNTESVQ